MTVPTVLSLAGNFIALLVLGWKTFYDLVWNARRFEKEKATGVLQAARAKRERSDFTTAITFLILALSYTLLIGETLMSQEESNVVYVSREEFDSRLERVPADLSDQFEVLNQRVQDIEDYLFPPGGPTSPTEFNKRLKELDDRLEALDQRSLETKADFQELVEIVAELKKLVVAKQDETHKETKRLRMRG